MITHAELLALTHKQAEINASFNEFWVEARYPYDRLIAGLASAAIAHKGGWGWAGREPGAARRGLGTIWRCVMSRYLVRENANPSRAARALSEELNAPWQVFFDLRAYKFESLATFAKLELFGAMALAGRVYPPLFAAIMEDCGVTWTDLRAYYVGEEPSQLDMARFQELVPVEMYKLLPA